MNTPYEFQKDKINPDVLNQSKHWRDRSGKLYNVEDMSKWHAAGACRKLFQAFGASVMKYPIYKALQKQSFKG